MEDTEDLNKKLAELKAERAERERAAEEKREAERPTLIRAGLEAFLKAEAEHGALGQKICAIEADGVIIAILKKPTHAQYRVFTDSPCKSDDMLKLVTRCRVWPSASDFEALMERYPALLGNATVEVAKLAGESKLAGK